jgi:hypothetical protein
MVVMVDLSLPSSWVGVRVADQLFQLVQLAIVHIRPATESPHKTGCGT